MRTPQQPLQSGFGSGTTAAEVLDGINLSGRLAIVTGGASGIGLATVRALAGAGAHVVVPVRRVAEAQRALADIERVEIDTLDLADLDSVRAFASRFLDSGRSVDMLIANAGVMACAETRVGPGWELQFATNHLGHFALVNALWRALVADGGARVVAVSSNGHQRSSVRFDDLHFEREYDRWAAYGQSKTANVLFAVHADALGEAEGVRAFAVHPGGILTQLQRHLDAAEREALMTRVASGSLKTPEQGAATSVWAATSPALAGKGGVYCEDCDIAAPSAPDRTPGRSPGVDAYAVDPDAAARLWAISAQLTGIDRGAAVGGDANGRARGSGDA